MTVERFEGMRAPVSGSKSSSLPGHWVTIATDCLSSLKGLPMGAKVVNEPLMALLSAFTVSTHVWACVS